MWFPVTALCTWRCLKPQWVEVGWYSFFLFCKKKKNRSENCQNHCRSAGVTSISFPSIRRERRNKERPPIPVMKFIPWMHGSEVQLIDSVSWQKLSNLKSWRGKKGQKKNNIWIKAANCSEPRSCDAFCLTAWKLQAAEMSGWNAILWWGKHQSGMSRWLFLSALVREKKTQTGTNGCNQVDEHRAVSFHVPLWPLTVRFLQNK